jgi:uncharacterized paraquat-inducible protein A
MILRKCPSCREVVGAGSAVCPRCGVNFRGAAIRRVIRWTLIVGLTAWILIHFIFKAI